MTYGDELFSRYDLIIILFRRYLLGVFCFSFISIFYSYLLILYYIREQSIQSDVLYPRGPMSHVTRREECIVRIVVRTIWLYAFQLYDFQNKHYSGRPRSSGLKSRATKSHKVRPVFSDQLSTIVN